MIYLLLLGISTVVHWQWISNLSVLTWGDWMYFDIQTLKELLSFPSIWSNVSYGGINIGISFFPFQLIYGVLANLGFDYAILERVVFLWPILFFFPLFSYLFIKKLFKNTTAAVVGSIVYSYNTYFSAIKTGHMTLLVAFSLFPLVLLLYQHTLEKKSFKYSLVTSLVLFVISFYEFRAFYILTFILIFYFLFYIFSITNSNLKTFFRICALGFTPIFITGLLNIYWLLPIANTGNLVTNAFFSRLLFGNEFLNINNAFTLYHPFWTGGRTTDFIVQEIPLIFYFLTFLALAGLYLNRKNRMVLFFGFIFLFGILLVKQVGHPISSLYPWLYNNFPGFNAFREASKFFSIVALGYSVLIASLVSYLLKTYKKSKSSSAKVKLLISIIIFLFLWNTKPFITGEIATLFVPRQIPEDYVKLRDVINSDEKYFRTLWVPAVSRWSYFDNNHPAVSSVIEIHSNWKNFLSDEINADKYTEAELVVRFLNDPSANNILDESAIRYLIIPIEDDKNDDNFYRHYGKTKEYYVKELEKLEYLERVNFGTYEAVVFENHDYKPHVFLSTKSQSDKDLGKLEREFINASEYKIYLKNVSGDISLNFSETYHSGWNIRVGDFEWIKTLDKEGYAIDEENHTKSSSGFNSFRLNIEEVCKVNECEKNNNGTYDLNLRLYFQPQLYLYVGLVISAALLVLVIVVFLFLNRKK